VKEFRHLHYGMRKSFTFDARLWAQQSAWMPNATRCKRPGQLSWGVILQHSNATQHSVRWTQGSLPRRHWDLPDHSILPTLTRSLPFFRAAEATPEGAPIPL
jgi:hypothetical protein